MITDPTTFHLQPVLLNLASKMDYLPEFGQKWAKIAYPKFVFEAKFSKTDHFHQSVSDEFWMS